MELDRFKRTELLLGAEAMRRLAGSRIMVVGMGAVGSYAVEALARSGVGGLTLVDFDAIHTSNLNRQLFALESTLGRPKIDVATERVRDIHPACQVTPTACFINDESAPGLLAAQRPDVLIDAIDSLNAKVSLLYHAVDAGIPVVSSMGAATRTDPLAVRVADLADTAQCPLARFVRKRLRRRGIESGIRCIYSLEPAREEARGELEAAVVGSGRPRQVLGSFACVTGVFGLTAAREAISMLVEWP